MNKADLVSRVAAGTGLTQVEVAAVVEGVLEGISTELVDGGHVEIRVRCSHGNDVFLERLQSDNVFKDARRMPHIIRRVQLLEFTEITGVPRDQRCFHHRLNFHLTHPLFLHLAGSQDDTERAGCERKQRARVSHRSQHHFLLGCCMDRMT